VYIDTVLLRKFVMYATWPLGSGFRCRLIFHIEFLYCHAVCYIGTTDNFADSPHT